jgi:hypothetical protein
MTQPNTVWIKESNNKKRFFHQTQTVFERLGHDDPLLVDAPIATSDEGMWLSIDEASTNLLANISPEDISEFGIKTQEVIPPYLGGSGSFRWPTAVHGLGHVAHIRDAMVSLMSLRDEPQLREHGKTEIVIDVDNNEPPIVLRPVEPAPDPMKPAFSTTEEMRLVYRSIPSARPTYLGPTYLGPTYLGPTYLGPTYLGPTYLGPTRIIESRARSNESTRLLDNPPTALSEGLSLAVEVIDTTPDPVDTGEATQNPVGRYPFAIDVFSTPEDYSSPDEEMAEISELRSIPSEVKDRISYLSSLPSNWDQEGAESVSQATVDRALGFLSRAFAEAGGLLPTPFIGAAFDGMLVMEWKTDSGKELITDIPAQEEEPVGFLLVEPNPSGGEREIDSEIGASWSPEQLIRRLLDN